MRDKTLQDGKPTPLASLLTKSAELLAYEFEPVLREVPPTDAESRLIHVLYHQINAAINEVDAGRQFCRKLDKVFNEIDCRRRTKLSRGGA